MLTTRTKHDWGTIFSEFFQLKDWKQRSLYIGGFYLILFSLWILFNVVFFISGSTGLNELIVLILYFFAQTPLVLISLYSLYLYGYQIELVNFMLEDKPIENLNFFVNYQTRIKQGFKYFLSLGVYNIPPFVIMITGYAFIMIFVMQSSNSIFVEPGVPYFPIVGLILSGIFILGGIVLQLLVQFVINPLIAARFINTKNIISTIDFAEVRRDARLHMSDLFLIGLIMYILQMVYSFALYISLITVFICIGLFLFPLIMIVGAVYSLHFRARMIANLSKTIKLESS